MLRYLPTEICPIANYDDSFINDSARFGTMHLRDQQKTTEAGQGAEPDPQGIETCSSPSKATGVTAVRRQDVPDNPDLTHKMRGDHP
ncbi:hypothetical protein [Thioalkalivibrio sp. ALM2T]|uniref:hypothetical protein n=1 Tax=Thioalkalivibrio sp. ALM2T TaxID=1158184 RepID=UPI0018C9C21F|nr:hypothetical protein [Thioalkalivibrio sp. ALM2T]